MSINALNQTVLKKTYTIFAFFLLFFLSTCSPSKSVTQPVQSIGIFKPVFSTSADSVKKFIAAGNGGTHAKLVYVDFTSSTRTLCYVDFSENANPPIIHTIAQAKDPAVPVISPDGNWVTYASGPVEGIEAGQVAGTKSSVYVCRLEETAQPILVAADSAREPRFMQNVSGKLTIIYPTEAPNRAWEGHGATMKVDVDISGTSPIVGQPQILCGYGGYTGGLSWDSRYLCGGGDSVAMLDLSNTAKTQPNILSWHHIQSCNASISSSRLFSNTMMYLNFGDNSTSPFGKPYSMWQAVLISNYSGALVKGFLCPDSGKFTYSIESTPPSFQGVKWHHCEWSNHPYFAAATININRVFSVNSGYEHSQYQERIYVLNIKDSTYLEILRPDTIKYSGIPEDNSGFYWPWFWVEVPAGFSEDPSWLK